MALNLPSLLVGRRVVEPLVLLVDRYNPANNLGVEVGFAASRFRTLDELKQQDVEENEAVAWRQASLPAVEPGFPARRKKPRANQDALEFSHAPIFPRRFRAARMPPSTSGTDA